jgi:hypothetical protein
VESKQGPLGTSATYWPIVPAPGDCEDGKFGRMSDRGNRSTRREPAPAPLCPQQIPLDQTRDWTRAAAVGSQRLTASAMARPLPYGSKRCHMQEYRHFDTRRREKLKSNKITKIIRMLPVVLYECESWTSTLREGWEIWLWRVRRRIGIEEARNSASCEDGRDVTAGIGKYSRILQSICTWAGSSAVCMHITYATRSASILKLLKVKR